VVTPVNLTVPIRAIGAEGLKTLHLELVFDPLALEVMDVSLDQGLKDALLDFDISEPGKVAIGVIDPHGFSGDAELLQVRLLVHRPDLNLVLELSEVVAFGGEALIDIPVTAADGEYGGSPDKVTGPVINFGM